LIKAGDGWCYIPHTPEEYAALWKGVDAEACDKLS
jgi:hypothetical protein